MGRLDVGVEVILAEVEVAAMLALQSVVFLVLFLKQKYIIAIISYRNISNILKGRCRLIGSLTLGQAQTDYINQLIIIN